MFLHMLNTKKDQNQNMSLIYQTKEGTQLWLGDYYAATKINILKQKGIRSVLTAAAMIEVIYPSQSQINHKTINAYDFPSFRMAPHFQDVFQFISDSLKKGNVLVHCVAGISRSATFVIAYLMRAEGINLNQAMNYVRSKRPIIFPNEGFRKELKEYEFILIKNLGITNEKQKQMQAYQSSVNFESDQQQQQQQNKPSYMNQAIDSSKVPQNERNKVDAIKKESSDLLVVNIQENKIGNIQQLKNIINQQKQVDKELSQGIIQVNMQIDPFLAYKS